MDINELTIGQAKELAAMFGSQQVAEGLNNFCIGSTVVVRTYSAGVWCGSLRWVISCTATYSAIRAGSKVVFHWK